MNKSLNSIPNRNVLIYHDLEEVVEILGEEASHVGHFSRIRRYDCDVPSDRFDACSRSYRLEIMMKWYNWCIFTILGLSIVTAGIMVAYEAVEKKKAEYSDDNPKYVLDAHFGWKLCEWNLFRGDECKPLGYLVYLNRRGWDEALTRILISDLNTIKDETGLTEITEEQLKEYTSTITRK